MPGKRARNNTRANASSSSSPQFDRSRFLSYKKEEFYSNVLAHLECVKERGAFYREGRLDPLSMQEFVETRKWKVWVIPTPVACEVMTREFFANSYCGDQDNKPDPLTFSSWFRGNTIGYKPKDIRRVLGLLIEDVERTLFPWKSTYHDLLSDYSSEFRRDLRMVVVRPGQNWHTDDKGDITYVRRTDLTPLAQIWAEFLQDSLFPSSHKTEVRAVVLIAIYCIIRGHPMDVARIISQRIYSHYNESKDTHRPIFPHLIYRLVTEVRGGAGRPPYTIEKRLPVARVLSKVSD